MDIARVDQLRRHLRENPQYHRQLEFACGTTACAAGWAVALEHGAKTGNSYLDALIIRVTMDAVTTAMWEKWDFAIFENDEDSVDAIAIYARMLLDFSADEARAVFFDTLEAHDSEADAVALLDALVHREKGELTVEDVKILIKYDLPLEPDSEVTND
jgi:hypothetical protein